MRILVVLGLLIFVVTWQKFSLALLFLLPTFYALYRENFLILWARKSIIKNATLNKNALFYKLTEKNTLLYVVSFCLAFVGIVSLLLNLMYASRLDLAFLLVLFPLLFIGIKKAFASQFRKNPYNTLKIVLFSALLTGLFYSISQLFFKERYEPFFYLHHFLDTYKVSSFQPLDTLSLTLHFAVVFKNFMVFWLESMPVKFLIFGFELLNFFILCSSFALLCSFVLKSKKSTFVWLVLSLLSLVFYEERINLKPLYQERLSAYLKSIENPFLEQNLSTLKEQNENLQKQLSTLKELFNKNAFEIGLWWLSSEKDELKKSLQKAVP